ncbi:3TM-type holin [Burkholderia arboris]|uniref:3TM-type holin n=1 Tax=Burkholderia arboris TaxID=488730 RepID=UPI00210D1223|nr:3TM-type holin [Burkholderia arboris]UTV53243.1 3TM-type holin [Burkholderia arboris]
MSLLDTILSPGGGAFALLDDIVKRVWKDPAQVDAVRLQLLDLQQKGELAQLDADLKTQLAQAQIDDDEAKSESLFKSGWRPFVGWSCGAGVAYMLVARPFISWACEAWWHVAPPPTIDIMVLQSILFGMLGLATARTVEKIKGAN